MYNQNFHPVTAVRWYDNKVVDRLSNYVGAETQDTSKRYDQDKCFVEVPRPAVIRDYNTFMGGVDLLDSLTSLESSQSWYKYIIHHT